MHRKKGLHRIFMGLTLLLTLSIAVGLGAFSQTFSARAASSSWPTLSQGSSGENVYSIQLMLQEHRYSLSIDGSYGPQTASVVKSFQSTHGLSADGIVGPLTWPVLIVTTRTGSSGPDVIALQRQLNAHGASLSVDGRFGSLTEAAVRSYQGRHGLRIDGIAGLQTWNSLVSTVGSPPPPPPHGATLWGVDTAGSLTPSFLRQIKSHFGVPAFLGRYLDEEPGNVTALTASEVSYIHRQNIRILPIISDLRSGAPGGDTTTSVGVARAKDALAKAHALSIPAKTVIFADIENATPVDAGFIEGWYATISRAGYTPGYYANPYQGSSSFANAFCSAVSRKAAISRSILYATEPNKERTPRSSAPPFGPASVICGGHATGQTLVWQYGIQGGGSVNVDTDELQSSVPLW